MFDSAEVRVMARKPWWGHFRLRVGKMSSWDIGPFRLRVHREAQQWRLGWENSGDPLSDACEVHQARNIESMPDGLKLVRFGAEERDERFEVRPALGDRPFVAKPEEPLRVLPGDSVTLFITTPVTVGVYLHGAKEPDVEFPSVRAPDTWFGRDTTEGELCFASRTWARMTLENFGFWPHRAITSVFIRNRASVPLSLDRIKLPIPNLSLYADEDGTLRTSGLLLKKDDENELAHARLLEGGEAEKRWRLIEPPRVELKHRWLEAFSEIF